MAIDFPNSPTNGDLYTVGGKTWQWNGTFWAGYGTSPDLTISDTPPASPNIGDQWFESDTGRWLVYYDNAWVELTSSAVVSPNANDLQGTTLASSVVSSSLTSVGTLSSLAVSGGIAQGGNYLTPYSGFRNAIINGDFRINQRGLNSTGTTTSNTYGYDRWRVFNVGGTVTMSSQQFTVGSPAATGYESPNFVRLVTASQSASGDYAVLQQPIEDVRTFANSTVTISFWAKAASGTPSVTIELSQVFGTGGSPSADVNNLCGGITLSTSWTRYSVTTTLPNINGKTIGTTANTSTLNLNLWVSAAGVALLTRLPYMTGAQNNTFDFWGVQVERGSVATPFEQRPIGAELALCQRYYEKGSHRQKETGIDTARSRYSPIYFKVTKRITPTSVSNTNTDQLYVAAATFNAFSPEMGFVDWTGSNSFDFLNTCNWTASSEF